jgi:hypothetical protein
MMNGAVKSEMGKGGVKSENVKSENVQSGI